jgi:L-amino acid N-acyltransferase YncA
MELKLKPFCQININDPFFDSLRADYAEFGQWFARKAHDLAYVFEDEQGVNGFLYLKIENEAVNDVTPALPARRRLKVGTMKINARGTRLGERFIKKIFDHALHFGVEEIYVTVFAAHATLITLFTRYGFASVGEKHSANGVENVLLKRFVMHGRGLMENYPMINLNRGNIYLLSLYPQWHTRLLPDSILHNEDAAVLEDISHTNSIHKVYLAKMDRLDQLRPGDVLVIYRTSDGQGPAHYRSVATSVGVVEDYRNIHTFASRQEFLDYCRPYSVFTEAELEAFWNRKTYPHVFRFTYNAALKRRVTRGEMIENMGLDPNAYWGFMPLTRGQFQAIAQAGQLDESLIVN